MLDQLLHEILGLGRGKMFIERNDQKMSHTKRADQSDLVRCRREQVWRFFGPQYFFGVRIEGDYQRRSIHRPSVFSRSRNDSLMSEMDAVEDTDREEQGTLQVRELRDGLQRFHHQNDEGRKRSPACFRALCFDI